MKRVVIEDSGESECEEVDTSENEDQTNESISENDDGDVESDGAEGSQSDEQDSDVEAGSKNLAWADSVSKILKSKPKSNKPLVLSKAKKLTEVKAKPKETGFEVVLKDGEVKHEVVEGKTTETKDKIKKEKKTKEIPGLRVKPNILEKDRERLLAKIATRGVVQLFNAVKNQQKDINEKLREAGPLEVRKEKVMKNMDKNAFLDVLMGQKSQNVDEVMENSNPIKKQKLSESKEENGSNKVWDVLKDNYMMDAKMKDWDKELEIDES